MTAEELGAIYDASAACVDVGLAIALLRGLADPVFAQEARIWLDAPPEARRALAAVLDIDAAASGASGPP